MKVLLIQPAPPQNIFDDSLPIGLAYIASYLKKNGLEVEVIDLAKKNLTHEFKPDIVGIAASTPYAKNAIKTSHLVRNMFPNSKIIFGGHHFGALPDEAFPHADAVVIGEGETAMLDICQNGIKTKIIHGTEIKDIDSIPMLDEKLFDFIYKGRKSKLYVVGARGCPFSCKFCSGHSRNIRYHSPDYFVKYLEIVAKRYGDDIFISDDIFTMNKKRVIEICNKINSINLKIKLRVFGHVNYFDRDLIESMKKAGVHTISYGIESGNNDILKLINKNFTVEQAESVIRKTQEAGVTASCLYMLGNLGENEQTIQDTVNFAIKMGRHRWCSYALPLPGSEFYLKAHQYGTILTKDWDLYTNQHIVYLPKNVSKKFIETARNKIMPGNKNNFINKIFKLFWNN